MKKYPVLILMMCLTVQMLTAQTEVIEKNFTIEKPGMNFELTVDNVWGSVTVQGISGNTVKAVIRKTVRAKSDADREWAGENIFLDISREDSFLEFYVDGPFRDQDGLNRDSRRHSRHTEVVYEFDLKIPAELSVHLSTVNDGDIRIDGVHGNYRVENVNGGISMTGIRGSGEVSTINGDVVCTFDANPEADCTFGSLNGDVKLYFRDPLEADFSMKTFNGDAWSDFRLEHMASDPQIVKEEGGRMHYQITHRTNVRAGNGGPCITLNGFNGDLFILNGRKGEKI